MDQISLLGVVLTNFFITGVRSDNYLPIIYPQFDSITFQSKHTLTLGCIGAEPVNWSLPFESRKHKIYMIDIPQQESIHPHYVYGVILTIDDISGFNIGHYTCHGITANKNSPIRSRKIYVYVDDDTRLMLYNYRKMKYDSFLNTNIPCMPTSPDVKVTLMQKFNNMLYDEVPENMTEFDSQYGYILPAGTIITEIPSYMCLFEKNNIIQNMTIDLNAKATENYNKPYINSDKYILKYTGDHLELNCSLITKHNSFRLDWNISNNILFHSKRVTIMNEARIPIVENDILLSKLWIRNLSLEDSGKYKCYIASIHEDLYYEVNVMVTEKSTFKLPEIDYESKNLHNNSDISYLKINSEEDLTLNCYHHKNVTWSYPDEDLQIIYLNVEVTYSTIIRNNVKLYQSTLYLTESHYSNGGFYYCHEIGEEKNNLYASTNIYVFVKDEGNIVRYPLEENNGNIIDILSENNSFWVPCIPTSPDVKVMIVEIKYRKLYPKYDPRFGFEFSRSEYEEDNIDLTCEYKRGNFLENRLMHGVLDSMREIESKTNIIAPFGETVMTYQKLILKCTTIVNNTNKFSLQWEFPNTNKNESITNINKNIFNGNTLIISTITIENVDAEDDGPYKCFIKNINDSSSSVHIAVKPIPIPGEPFIRQLPTSLGYQLVLKCYVFVHHNQRFRIQWNLDYKEQNNRLMISNVEYKLGIKGIIGSRSLIINNTTLYDQGNYSCTFYDGRNNEMTANHEVILKEPEVPIIFKSNMNNTDIELKYGDSIILMCFAQGNPEPNIIWIKDNKEIHEDNNHLKIMSNRNELKIHYTNTSFNGKYICVAKNMHGSDFKFMNVILQNKNIRIEIFIFLTIGIIILMITFVVLCNMKLRKMKRFRKRMQILQRKKHTEDFNIYQEFFEMQLLPIASKWEIPRNKIKLRERIGSGNFGIVMRADLLGLSKSKPRTNVAVKMVKNCDDYTELDMFIAELKIMMRYVGQHLNIINLIGVCTNNFAQGELLIIIEYCKFGNLRNYLISNRDNFKDVYNNENSVYINISNRPAERYGDLVYYNIPTTNKKKYVNANDSIQNPISTHDLIYWSYQIAQGMHYLSSHNVLHGDLAARNILLTDNNIVKICDFGLAKSLYKVKNYKKNKQVPMPIRWMAVESIQDGIFSTQSDVWSFGIVLWELFSLAQVPYPDQTVDSEFYRKITSGYRMEQPKYSSKEMYQIMRDCWHGKPSERPTFTQIVKNFEGLLEKVTLQSYNKIYESAERMYSEKTSYSQD